MNPAELANQSPREVDVENAIRQQLRGHWANKTWSDVSAVRQTFPANAARPQLHASAYNIANVMRMFVMPNAVERWSLTSLTEKRAKIGV